MAANVGYSPRVIACPSCPKCGTRMVLVHIFPDRLGRDQRTYECPRCEHEVTEIFQLEELNSLNRGFPSKHVPVPMSAFDGKADIDRTCFDVRF